MSPLSSTPRAVAQDGTGDDSGPAKGQGKREEPTLDGADETERQVVAGGIEIDGIVAILRAAPDLRMEPRADALHDDVPQAERDGQGDEYADVVPDIFVGYDVRPR